MTEIESGTQVWENTYDLQRKTIQGLYYNWGDDVREYPYLMQDVMNDAIEDMSRSLPRD